MSIRENDPVTDPTGYRELVLSFLGDDDPAEAQSRMPRVLEELVADAGDRLAAAPAEGEWSVLQLVSHLIHSELVAAFRYRAILTEEEPRLAPYDQDVWVDRLPLDDSDPAGMLRLFAALRTANLALWAASGEAERARIGIHEERGPESFELSFRLIAGHDRLHHEQARDTLKALETGATS